jgi:hypothetical protein
MFFRSYFIYLCIFKFKFLNEGAIERQTFRQIVLTKKTLSDRSKLINLSEISLFIIAKLY